MDGVAARSNAGLELALANNDRMAATDDHMATLNERMLAIHPTPNLAARQRVVAIGEVAYAREQGEIAKAWIAEHPAATARLWVRHMRQMVVPERWNTEIKRNTIGLLQSVFLQGIGLCGIAGGLLLLYRQPGRGVYPVALFATIVVLSAPFQPVNRYTYLLYPLSCFLATGLPYAMTMRWRGRRPTA